ncbi:MAG: formate dehydrogenase accessory sulfurtransferase FdhD [Candidatus Nanopelagicales bacterium]
MTTPRLTKVINRFKVKKTDKSTIATDSVVGEEPLEIRTESNGADSRLAITMRTPGHDLELTSGFLWTEGLLRNREDLISITSCKDPNLTPEEAENVVVAHLKPDAPAVLRQLDRRFMISSACGICGTTQIEDLVNRGVKKVSPCEIELDQLAKLPERMRSQQKIFSKTGGLHAAGLVAPNGEFIVVREDVGRHNAVDKVIGFALMQNMVPLSGFALVISGRGGFEIVQKAVAAGIGALVAVSAPTSLAVETARKFDLKLLGFAREGVATIYSPEFA